MLVVPAGEGGGGKKQGRVGVPVTQAGTVKQAGKQWCPQRSRRSPIQLLARAGQGDTRRRTRQARGGGQQLKGLLQVALRLLQGRGTGAGRETMSQDTCRAQQTSFKAKAGTN